MQAVLDRAKGKPQSFAVNFALLRSLEQAVYSPSGEGHFALASEDYAHFTSPIRRYPDLTVHRLLDAHVRGALKKRRGRAEVPTIEEVEALGVHCSRNERRAEAAERELRLLYILRLLEEQIGSEFDGLITGVANFGLFVQLPVYLVDGLLRFSDLPDDWWEVDAEAGCVTGQRTGRQLKIGDRLRVRIAGIDLADRKLDLAPAEGPQGATGRRKKPTPATAENRAGRRKKKAPRQGAKKRKSARKRRGR